MSIDIRIRPHVALPSPEAPQTAGELQEAIDALEKEAEGVSPDRHEQFLTTVKRHAGLILQILDRVEAKGMLPFNYLAPVRMVFRELRDIGEELAQATKVNHQQYASEKSALEGYKNFKIVMQDLHEIKEFQVPTFGELMKRSPSANSGLQQNGYLTSMAARLIRMGSGAAKAALSAVNPSTQVGIQKTKVLLKAKKIAESPAVYRCFNKAGEYVTSVPSREIPQHKAVYFHATGLREAEQILRSGKIKRVDLSAYKGAFVSSRLELGYGPMVFALNRSIETVPVLNAQFDKVLSAHWVGFSSSIPVNLETLEYVAVDVREFSTEDISEFAAKLSKAAGREIQVKSAAEVAKTVVQRLDHENVCVPEEWPLTFQHPVDVDTKWL